MRALALSALLLAAACAPPEKTAAEVRMDQRFARLGSAQLQGVVSETSSVGEIIMFRSDDEDSGQASFTLEDGTEGVRITYLTADTDGPLVEGERVGADIDLIVPVQLGTPSIDQESVAVARKIWHLPEEGPAD